MERIAKFIARCGVTSRRKAEELIKNGYVFLNGTIIRELSVRVDPSHDSIVVNNKHITVPPLKYFLLHKPKGVITTKQDTHSRKTVLDFFPHKYRDIHPVGRLDKDTTGALLLTNDGALTNVLIHPRHGVTKTYEVVINGCITPQHQKKLRKGIALEDGITQPADVFIQGRKKHATVLTIKIKEGKKRQIKRMCMALGYRVIGLKRTAFGSLRIGNMKEGSYRPLTTLEIKKLREHVDETQ